MRSVSPRESSNNSRLYGTEMPECFEDNEVVNALYAGVSSLATSSNDVEESPFYSRARYKEIPALFEPLIMNIIGTWMAKAS